MKRKYFILMLNVAAVVMLSIMYGAKNATMGMRFLLPGMVLLTIIFMILYELLRDSFATGYMISRRSYFKKNKKKTSSVAHVNLTLLDILLKLPKNYIIISRYEKMSIEIDYLVIGPTGIFVVKSNDIRVKVEVSENSLSIDGRDVTDRLTERIKINTGIIESDFRTFNKRKNLIKPIICLTNGVVSNPSQKMVGELLVLSKDDIVTKIEGYPTILDMMEVTSIYSYLKKNANFLSCRNATS